MSTESKALDFEYTNDISPNIIRFVDKFKLEGVPYEIPKKKSEIDKMCVNS